MNPDGPNHRLSPLVYRSVIETALREDLGNAGDLTSDAIIHPSMDVHGYLVARQPGTICGLDVALEVFRQLDLKLKSELLVDDGQKVVGGEELARIHGRASALLAAERTALNLLGRLSGIATATADLVARIASYQTRLVCTRKTTPGLRALEKYAVRTGGGGNHRFGLYDAVLIKDNHILIAGGVTEAVRRAKRGHRHLVPIEIEVDDLDQLDEVLAEDGVDAVLLDNMSLAQLKTAAEKCRGKVISEASGGIGPDNIEAIAQTGVDFVSVGWITHSADSLDVGFDLQSPGNHQAAPEL